MLQNLKKSDCATTVKRLSSTLGSSCNFLKYGREKQEGFASIVEVIVTSVVFVLATAGILTTVSMLRPHGEGSSRKIEAAYIAKGIMDDLRRQVDGSTWNNTFGSSNLAVGPYGPFLISGYNVVYTITEPIPNLRELTMNITWPD